MTEFAPNTVFPQIEDRLDVVGQQFRVQRLVRGAVLFISTLAVSTVLACVLASWTGSGPAVLLVPAVWLAGMAVAFFFWIVKPLALRVQPAQIARLLEARVEGLHNGLTNSVLLARRADIQDNPWLGQILDENWKLASDKDLTRVITLRDLRPIIWRAALALLASAGLGLAFHGTVARGWQQMVTPSAFVPRVGHGKILEVKPGDATLIYGQPLEVTILGQAKSGDDARLIFDNASAPISLSGTQQDADSADPALSTWRFAHRLDHVEQSVRYRVELAGTQSPWYQVTVVRQVKLQSLALQVIPPSYTRHAGSLIALKPDEIDKTPVSVPQGSAIDLSFSTDVPVSGAILQTGEAPPVQMKKESSGQSSFSGRFTVLADTPVSLLVTDGAGQILARLPEQSLTIRCIKDGAPIIEMRWPTQDTNVAPDAELKIQATLKDDYGLASMRVLSSSGADQPMTAATSKAFSSVAMTDEVAAVLNVPKEQRKHGNAIRVQIEATDNRDLTGLMKDGGAQVVTSNVYEIRFRDPAQLAAEQKELTDKLRARLMEMLKKQQDLLSKSVGWKAADMTAMAQIQAGQIGLRDTMQNTADTFEFDAASKVIQKTLQVLVHNAAAEAIELAGQIPSEKQPKLVVQLHRDLQSRQRRVISTLESLLALLNNTPEPTTQPSQKPGGDLVEKAEAFKKLDEALKQFIKEEQRIMDQSANLAKKPVDNWDEKDKKLLEELQMAQEKLDAFMQTKVNDLSKLAEQDMANSTMLKELLEVYSEVTMAKDALKAKAMEIAVPAEEAGVELAKALESNLEKWLMDTPDRQKWTQEEMPGKTDVPMAELPTELEDMIGELMEQQEDLFDDVEDMDANIADSLDKGAGWDAADGPIANMSAKGVTGNVLPNNNNMNGRSGEGRSGKSQGEFVEDTATGKGGRNTPTRLDPTPFEKGQVKDESKDPVGGATGGGKMSGQGGQGLEGPLAPKMKQEMQRLAEKQAQLRNQAERLNLQYQLGRYDNFKLTESIAMMRRVESDLKSNRYQTALRRRDVMLDAMDSSKALVGGTIHVQHDTTPTTSAKVEQDIHDAMKGQLPAAWSDALKEYYRKLAAE